MFCATNADSADMNDIGTIDKNTNSFSDMPMPAEAMSPSELTMLVIIRNDTVFKKSCSAIGEPIFSMPAAERALPARSDTSNGSGCLRM